jgi:mRNA-degrading endonuclease RelE of RelBE toxin-antitoxin system
MQSEPPSIQIALTPQFKRDIKDLSKRYYSIRSNYSGLKKVEVFGQHLKGQVL